MNRSDCNLCSPSDDIHNPVMINENKFDHDELAAFAVCRRRTCTLAYGGRAAVLYALNRIQKFLINFYNLC